jgi:diguanylate cyclase (GGDEF)-like protein
MVASSDKLAPRVRGEAVMLVSFSQRDALTADLGALGCRVTGVRRLTGLAERLVKCNASVVIVDLRGATSDGLEAVKALAGLCETRGAALVALYDRRVRTILVELVEAGVSMVLPAPFTTHELAAAVALGGRAARRALGIPAPIIQRPPSQLGDALTGLADAHALRHWVDSQLATERLSLLAINLSRFDVINSAFGPDVGDAALRALAHRIDPLVAETPDVSTLFARMSGAEFAVALAGKISSERLQLLAEAIVDAVGRPFSTGREMVRIGCRIGVVRSGPSDKSASRLIKRAHAAMAEAKPGETGPISFLVGNAADVADLTESLQADLRAALNRNEIDVLFQPQVAIANGRIEGAEALARWRHPRHGEIGAATLFAVAEQSDFIVELSNHIQKRTLAIAATWPDALAHIRLSVNVTASDMARPRFARSFFALLDDSGFPRERLTVEVTESGLMGDLVEAAKTLSLLRAGGCRVAIDDFGTGYSSLAYLNALPADYLKIDKGLADDIAGTERASLVVRGVIGLARSLGLSVIAEGVESEGQLAMLRREGCSHYQGYLCAPAVDCTTLAALVVERA